MKNLDKENFWNRLQELYPLGMKVFCDWVDEYKRKNNWNDLFGNGKITQRKHYWSDVKYHHIPLAFQIGMWIEFVGDTETDTDSPSETECYLKNINDWKAEIEAHLEFLNTDLEYEKNKKNG